MGMFSHAYLFDCVCHIFNSDAQEAFGDFFNGLTAVNFLREGVEFLLDDVQIQRLIRIGTKDRGELAGLQL